MTQNAKVMRDAFSMYQLQHSPVWQNLPYALEGGHRWRLPGVKCPRCGAGGTTGIAYPSVDLTGTPLDERLQRDPWPVSIQEFHSLVRAVQALHPTELLLLPGSELGPLEAFVRGQLADVSWFAPWYPLLSVRAVEALKRGGVATLTTAPPKLGFLSGTVTPMLEPEIPVTVRLAAGWFGYRKSPCVVCDQLGLFWYPRRIVIDAASVPPDLDMMRIRELPTHIIVSKRFRDACVQAGLWGVQFVEVRARH